MARTASRSSSSDDSDDSEKRVREAAPDTLGNGGEQQPPGSVSVSLSALRDRSRSSETRRRLSLEGRRLAFGHVFAPAVPAAAKHASPDVSTPTGVVSNLSRRRLTPWLKAASTPPNTLASWANT